MAVFTPDTLDEDHWSAVLRLAYAPPEHRSDAELEELAAQHIHAHNTDFNVNASTGIACGITHHLTVSAELPYVRRDDLREGTHNHVGGVALNGVENLGSITGVGDMSLLAKYRVSNGRMTGFALIGGIKVPTGSTHRHSPEGERQVIRSMPGAPCMRCLGFTTEAKLAREARAYGDAGDNPQVVWSNGVLASAAMGLVVDLLTPWCTMPPLVYLIYDGNAGIVRPSELVKYVGETCVHHPAAELGEPGFRYDPDDAVGTEVVTTGTRNFDVGILRPAQQGTPASGTWSKILAALFGRKKAA